jgi:hypothetical protein
MVIFNSYVKLPEGNQKKWWLNDVSWLFNGNITSYEIVVVSETWVLPKIIILIRKILRKQWIWRHHIQTNLHGGISWYRNDIIYKYIYMHNISLFSFGFLYIYINMYIHRIIHPLRRHSWHVCSKSTNGFMIMKGIHHLCHKWRLSNKTLDFTKVNGGHCNIM